MTPEDAQQIAIIGNVYFENTFGLIFACALNGVYLLGFAIAIRIFLEKENNGWAHKVLIAVLLAGFVFAELYTCSIFIVNLILVKFGLVVSLPGGFLEQEMAASTQASNIVTFILQNISGNLILLVVDMTIVWRALAVWVDNRVVKWSLLILMLMEIGVNIADVTLDSEEYLTDNGNTFITLDWVGIVVSLTVNIVATLLIAYKAWTHHHSMQKILPKRRSAVETILLLIIESGAIFGIVQVFNIIFKGLNVHSILFSSVYKATIMFNILYAYSAAINPVALVILVKTKNTYEHSFHQDSYQPA